MSSYTVSLTGNSSTLRSILFPALRLQKERLWEAALLDITTYNSIPNVTEEVNNKIHYYKTKDKKKGTYSNMEVFHLPTGAYEINDINEAFQNHLGKDNITITGNNNTLKAEIKSKYYIDFGQDNSIGTLLGFPKTTEILEPDKTHTGDNTVTIMKVNSIDVTCNIIQGSYRDGENRHILHTFYPTVAPGFKIVEKPQNLVYLPLNTTFISDIVVNILDQHGNLIDFRGEAITIRIHIKSTV